MIRSASDSNNTTPRCNNTTPTLSRASTREKYLSATKIGRSSSSVCDPLSNVPDVGDGISSESMKTPVTLWTSETPPLPKRPLNHYSSFDYLSATKLPFESRLQFNLRRVLASCPMEWVSACVIVLDFAILWYQADSRAHSSADASLSFLQTAISFFYMAEVVLRLGVERWRYFRSSWNILDATVIVIGIVGEFASRSLANLSGLVRLCRVARLLRMARLARRFEDLSVLISGLVSAVRTLFWAGILIFVILSMWSMVAVEFLHPLMEDIEASGMYSECPWCKDAFRSVMESNITLFGCISGGDWPMLARPLIVKHPWTAFIFLNVIFIMFFGMLNLITAVIVDAAAAARSDDLEKISRKRHAEQEKAIKSLEFLCQEMDTDKSGTISLGEVEEGYRNVPEFAAMMRIMDVGEHDLQCVFEMLDGEKAGEVDYHDFTAQLWRMKSQEMKTTLMFVKHYVVDMRNKVNQQLVLYTEQMQQQSLVSQLHMNQVVDVLQDALGEMRGHVMTQLLACDVTPASFRHLPVPLADPSLNWEPLPSQGSRYGAGTEKEFSLGPDEIREPHWTGSMRTRCEADKDASGLAADANFSEVVSTAASGSIRATSARRKAGNSRHRPI